MFFITSALISHFHSSEVMIFITSADSHESRTYASYPSFPNHTKTPFVTLLSVDEGGRGLCLNLLSVNEEGFYFHI
jgi:hypothetical protein